MAGILGELFGKVFGAGGDGDDAPVTPGEASDYKGFSIRPAPRRQGNQWLTAGLINKTVDGEAKEHHFIRADTFATKEQAETWSVTKARQIIDEQGERIFKPRNPGQPPPPAA